jgi:hypothetical protein
VEEERSWWAGMDQEPDYLVLSFRESGIPEAQFPRRPPLGSSVNRGSPLPCVFRPESDLAIQNILLIFS